MKRLISLLSVIAVAGGSATSVLACTETGHDYNFLVYGNKPIAGNTVDSYETIVRNAIVTDIAKAAVADTADVRILMAQASATVTFSNDNGIDGYIPKSGLLTFEIDFKDIVGGQYQLWNADFNKWSASIAKKNGWKEGTGLLLGSSYFVDPKIDDTNPSINDLTIDNMKLSDFLVSTKKGDTVTIDRAATYKKIQDKIVKEIKKQFPKADIAEFSPTTVQFGYNTITIPGTPTSFEVITATSDIAGLLTKLSYSSPDGYKTLDVGLLINANLKLKGAFNKRTIGFNITNISRTDKFVNKP